MFPKWFQTSLEFFSYFCLQLTLADLAAYDVAFQMKKVKNFDAPAKFPELQTLKTKVEENPNLKKYLETRKDTPL